MELLPQLLRSGFETGHINVGQFLIGSKQLRRSLNKKLLVTYSFPALAISIPTIPLYLYLPTFYGVTLELGLAATGFALLTARVFDTITDPIVE